MIVVDVGCAAHKGPSRVSGTESSIYRLADRFNPVIIFGFDPLLSMEEGIWVPARAGNTLVVYRRIAAAAHDAPMEFSDRGISSGIPRATGDGSRTVEAFRLASFLAALPQPIVLKLDCEGFEFPILHDLVVAEGDGRLERVLVEWHEGTDPNGDFYGHGWQTLGRPKLRCPVEEWA